MQKLAVVYFPTINLERINFFREKYDPNWNIIPPHVTLVSPISDITTAYLAQHIETIIKTVKSFPIEFIGLEKTLDGHIFLKVKNGNEKIISLHDKLYSGILALYQNKDIHFSPHITLGYFGSGNNFNRELCDKAYKEIQEIDLNMSCNFDNLTLITGDGLSEAKIIKTFYLSSIPHLQKY